ncbi:Bug family tripartite tricarboxylate transporter substrate binding protein [Ottowia thiooxydans]|uniref:Tripartite-type tricarboxylate transporter receptor subunit TctC n=1 Tax=Ottowia thiooxydans TaxID=219182 RepID=A0ABV2QCW5_9BURK
MNRLQEIKFRPLLAALVIGAFASVSGAQTLGDRPIKLIVPYSAGGGTDILARSLAESMSQQLKVPVIVDNRPGASGNIGVDAVAKAPADGHTLSFAISSNLMINQFLFKKLPYNPQKDLRMVAKVADAPLILVVSPATGVTTGAQLRTWASANKGKLSYGSWGIGTIAHMSAFRLSSMMQADMAHIAYKGEVPLMQDLIGGNIPMSYATGALAGQFIASGKLNAIAVLGPKRINSFPNVPTMKEAGFDDPLLNALGWAGVAAPAATPTPIINELAKAVENWVASATAQKRIGDIGWVSSFEGPVDFTQTYQRDSVLWANAVKQSGATLD